MIKGDYGEIKIPISSNDYRINGDNILLSPSAIEQLESALNFTIELFVRDQRRLR